MNLPQRTLPRGVPPPELDDPGFIVTLAEVRSGPGTELLFLACFAWGELDFRASVTFVHPHQLDDNQMRFAVHDCRLALLKGIHGQIQRHNNMPREQADPNS